MKYTDRECVMEGVACVNELIIFFCWIIYFTFFAVAEMNLEKVPFSMIHFFYVFRKNLFNFLPSSTIYPTHIEVPTSHSHLVKYTMCSGGKKVSESHHNKQQIAGISLRDVRGEIGGGMGKMSVVVTLSHWVPEWNGKINRLSGWKHTKMRENFSSVCIHNKHCHYVFITLLYSFWSESGKTFSMWWIKFFSLCLCDKKFFFLHFFRGEQKGNFSIFLERNKMEGNIS